MDKERKICLFGEYHLANVVKTMDYFSEVLEETKNMRNEEEKRCHFKTKEAMEKFKEILAKSVESRYKSVETVAKLKPEILYLEGNRMRECKEEPIQRIADAVGSKILFLDEGVKEYELIVKEYYENMPSPFNKYLYNLLQNRRENKWVKKIKDNKDGIVIVGTDHLESVSEKLSKINIAAETIYDIRKEKI